MKNKALTLSGIIILGTFLFTSCHKTRNSIQGQALMPETNTTTSVITQTVSPAGTPGFTWTAAGGASTVADSSFYTEGASGSAIRAYKGGAQVFEINFTTTTLSAAGYLLGPGHALTYSDNGNDFSDQSGNFKIMSVSNQKATGNYGGTAIHASSSATVALTLQFVGIPKR